MPRDQEALIDIFQSAQRVVRFTQGVTRPELEANEEKQAAILYQLTIIGEATKRLSPELRSQHPTIPWKQMAGMRDIVTHHYDEVDPDVVWDVVQDDIPQLIALLEPLVADALE
ncbi:MAG: DUF86 domain-containing protein [Leptolyngbyaceae cyanobacterium bins.302]|nr:DUF86 domain-containing protein [Leptolyngbyaceae cyanobacterium bins.302]